LYSSSTSITIPVPAGTYSVTPDHNAVAAMVPVFDASGDPVRLNDQTQFNAYAYSIVPESEYFASSNSDKSVLVETSTTFYCSTTASSELTPTDSCETDWSNGTTNLIFKEAVPYNFEDFQYPFEVSNGNHIKVVFGVKEGTLYFPESGSVSIDPKYIESIDIWCRNVVK
jgi:hypothetical protein